MSGLRFLLILFVSLASDLSMPLAPQAMEVLEESEEAVHRARGRGLVRPAREPSAPPATLQGRAESVQRPPRVPAGQPARPVAHGLARKTPLSGLDTPSAPDDH
jgi:hypothetical protein